MNDKKPTKSGVKQGPINSIREREIRKKGEQAFSAGFVRCVFVDVKDASIKRACAGVVQLTDQHGVPVVKCQNNNALLSKPETDNCQRSSQHPRYY